MRRAAIIALFLLATGHAAAEGQPLPERQSTSYPPANLQSVSQQPPQRLPSAAANRPLANRPLANPGGTILRVQGIAEQILRPENLRPENLRPENLRPEFPRFEDPSAESIVPPPPAGPRRPASLQVLPAANPDLVSLHADGAELQDVLRMIAQNHGLNLVIGPGVSGQVTLAVENARLEEVLDAILGVAGFAWHRRENLLYVTRLTVGQRLEASVQGRQLRIFHLNYMSATDAQAVAAGLLSPIGQVFISESETTDKTRTRELLVIEDLPDAIQRVEAYLAEVDQPPRQVLIEAHVLQVSLDDEHRHGLNLTQLLRLGPASLKFESLRHTGGAAAGGAAAGGGILTPSDGMLITLEGHDITGLVELIQSHTMSRTLASPKVLVANRQEANIQIGQKLGYKTTTTTQTSSLETINFLETGVVLSVVPVISSDGQILMTITPKVSNGRVVDELPEEDTTELTTTILLPDGGGVVIGGLIKEEDADTLSEVPWFSKIPYLGRLFRRKATTNRRTEIIIAMVTRVVPTVESIRAQELCELQKALPPYAAADLQNSGPLPPVFISPEMFGVEEYETELLESRPVLTQPTGNPPAPVQPLEPQPAVNQPAVNQPIVSGMIETRLIDSEPVQQ